MMNRLCLPLVVVLALASQTGQAQAPASPQAGPDYSQEAFVIERLRTVYRFENDGTGLQERQFRVRVQTDAGVQEWGQLLFGYNAATERVDIRFVRVLKADGSVVTAPDSAVQELTSPVQREAPVYTDFRQKHVTVPSLRPGETLDVSIATDVHTALAAGHFWMEHDFQELAVVLEEELEIDVPRGRSLILRTAADAEPGIRETDDRRIYRWTTAQTIPTAQRLREAADEEDESPPAVRLTTFQDWQEVGRWYAALERPSRLITPEIRATALEITRDAVTDLDKLEALYDYVARDFRYVSISLGLGRYQPRAAADVLRDQYGDCKDKHTLLAALLESLGLGASTVLIHSVLDTDPDFPSPSQFDHAITRTEIDGQAVWLDVTTEVAPFRLLTAGLRGKQALVVDAASTRLEETPADPPAGNVHAHDIEGALADSGTLTARVRLTLRGDLELLLRSIFHRSPQAVWRELVTEFHAGTGMGGEIGDWSVSDPRMTKAPFVIEYHLTRANIVNWTQRTFGLRLPLSAFELPAHPGSMSLDLGSPTNVRYRLHLDLSPGFTARAPQPVSIVRDYGEYRAEYRLDGQQFTAERTLRLTDRSLETTRAGDYTAFRRVVTADGAQVLSLDLPASAAVTAGADLDVASLIRTAAEAMRDGSFARAVPLFTRVVEQDPQNVLAWNGLGLAHAGIGDLDAALTAWTRQAEIDPFDEAVYNAMGSVYSRQRRYAEAEAAFRKQLEVNPLDQRAPALLGQLYLEMARYADAATALERAVAVAPESAALHVERGRAYLHLDRSDDALAAFARALEITSGAVIWNNIAYYLAQAGVHLDRARQHAESAVASAAADSRNFSVDRITTRELGIVRSLASYWDTLGWVLFTQGDLDGAARLIEASWRLGQSAVVGEHLGQVYEKQGRREDAIRMYAAALATERPEPSARDRLAALGETPERIDAAIRREREELVRLRIVALEGGPSSGTAELFVLLGPAGVEDVSFINGDDPLRAMTDAIRTASFSGLLPEPPAKVLRRGVLTCSASGDAGCSLILLRSGDAQPADGPR